ncbi:MarR family winged helix-turn-helix transcriptional regulator [Sphingomonas sp. Tas61C01]|uniref:MarR family winged helix-turn-helix transcriptional regulator n=1 Tax=Sphingomonas sp. Tas61C01 TaxID=3458297 RepID=UPI00403E55E5
MAFYSELDFYPDRSIGYLLRRGLQLTSVGLEPVFAPEGITLTQWSALVSIYFDRGTTCAELARDLAHDKGATTRIIDTLVERGWVTRMRHADDRRVINLALTEDGKAVAHHCRIAVIERWNDWLAEWSNDDAATLLRLLQKLHETMQAKIAAGAGE